MDSVKVMHDEPDEKVKARKEIKKCLRQLKKRKYTREVEYGLTEPLEQDESFKKLAELVGMKDGEPDEDE